MDLSAEEVFINLTVISKISSGDKLLMEDGSLLNIDTSLFPFLTRWWQGSNRMHTLQFINRVLTNAFLLNSMWIMEKNEKMLFRLTSDLKNALTGLNNLKQTYLVDKLVQSEIDVMMENIRSKLYSNYMHEEQKSHI